MSSNMDDLIELMVGAEELQRYKEKKLPDQVFGDLLHYIQNMQDSFNRINTACRSSRREILKIASEMVRSVIGDDDNKDSEFIRNLSMRLSKVNNQLMNAFVWPKSIKVDDDQ